MRQESAEAVVSTAGKSDRLIVKLHPEMNLFHAVLLRDVIIGWKRLIGADVHNHIGSLGAFIGDGSAFNMFGPLHAVAFHRTVVAVRAPVLVKILAKV